MREKKSPLDELASSKMPEKMVESTRKVIIEEFQSEGSEEALNKIDSILSGVETEECKAMLASYILTHLSLSTQVSLLQNHGKLVKVATLHSLSKSPQLAEIILGMGLGMEN